MSFGAWAGGPRPLVPHLAVQIFKCFRRVEVYVVADSVYNPQAVDDVDRLPVSNALVGSAGGRADRWSAAPLVREAAGCIS